MKARAEHAEEPTDVQRVGLARRLFGCLSTYHRPILTAMLLIVTFALGAAAAMARERLYVPYRVAIATGRTKAIHKKTNPSALIRLRSAGDVEERRQRLVAVVWGTSELGQQRPQVDVSIKDDRYADLENLARIDRLTVTMEYGINSIAYHLRAKEPNGGVMVYHQGHRGDFILGKHLFADLLAAGYDVIALAMPLLGLNTRPELDLPGFGMIQIASHDQLSLLELSKGTVLKFFLEPVLQSANYAQAEGFDRIFMMGISGGGWATTVYSALDTRIRRSYPFAGTLPIYLRHRPGDLEQTFAPFYRAANYLELYVLGTFEKGRHQLQILNKYDPCCFSGEKGKLYEGAVQQHLARLNGGTFQVVTDASHYQHQISSFGFSLLLEDLAHGRLDAAH